MNTVNLHGQNFTFGGLNADGTANWTDASGQTHTVSKSDAMGYGLDAGAAEQHYGANVYQPGQGGSANANPQLWQGQFDQFAQQTGMQTPNLSDPGSAWLLKHDNPLSAWQTYQNSQYYNLANTGGAAGMADHLKTMEATGRNGYDPMYGTQEEWQKNQADRNAQYAHYLGLNPDGSQIANWQKPAADAAGFIGGGLLGSTSAPGQAGGTVPTPGGTVPAPRPPGGMNAMATPGGTVTGSVASSRVDPSSRVGAAVHSGGTYQNANGVAGWQAPQFNPTETVEARLANLLESNSPLIENARKRALEQFAGRGLLNSSMASEGAMNAMIQSALPIASSDAAAINNVGMFNTELQTKAAQDYAAALNNWNTVQQALSKDQHSRYQDTLGTYQRMYQTEYQAIMMAGNIDAATKDAMLSDLESRYGAMYNSTNAIFSRAPGWQQSWLTVFGG